MWFDYLFNVDFEIVGCLIEVWVWNILIDGFMFERILEMLGFEVGDEV